MGANISIIESIIKNQKESKLFSLSLEQLKNYYALFKATCENFYIDYTEFKTIFNEDVQIFNLWDKNETCLIDALELFSGLTLFSETKFDEKIKLLFEIFDFNDLNSLSLTDIEFIIHCCINSTMRICDSKEDPQTNDIHILVNDYFREDNRVNLSQLIDFCAETQDILKFFMTIKRDNLEKTNQDESKKKKNEEKILPYLITNKHWNKNGLPESPFQPSSGWKILRDHKIKARNLFIETLAETLLLEERQRMMVKSSKLELNWVYGFRCNDTIKSFVYHGKEKKGLDKENLEQKIIYFVSTVVVLYYYKLNKQRHYTEHKNLVGSIAISKNKRICATGEKGCQPIINIWKIETLETILSIRSEYENDIYLLEFIKNDSMLITTFQRPDSPVIVYELKKGQIVTSTNFNSFIVDLLPVFDLSSKKNLKFGFNDKKFDLSQSFCCLSKSKLIFFGWNTHDGVLNEINIINNSTLDENGSEDEMTNCCCLYLDSSLPKASCYGDPKNLNLIFYVSTNTGSLYMVQFNQILLSWDCNLQKNFNKKIEQMVLFRKRYLCLATNNAMIHIYDMHNQEVIQNLDMTHLNINLNSMKIKNLVTGKNKTIFIGTWEGDIVKISMRQKQVWHQSLLINQVKGEKFRSIVHLPNRLDVMCLLKPNEEETLLYFGGSDCTLYCFSTKNHFLIEKWQLKHPITSVTGYVNEKGCINIAVGLSNGSIVFFINHKEQWTAQPYEGNIYDLKFSKNGKYLFASSANYRFYIYVSKKGVFIESRPSSDPLPEREIPISANFYDDSETVLIQSHSMKFFEYTVPKTNISPLSEVPNIKTRLLKFHYPYNEVTHDKRTLPIIMDKDLGIIFIGSNEGYISVFDSLETVKGNYESTFYGHSGAISDLELDLDKQLLYSVGMHDNTVFEWKILIDKIPIQDKISLKPDSNVLYLNGLREEIEVNQMIKSKQTYLEDSFGYFRGYMKEDLLKILDIQLKNPLASKEELKYPSFSMQLYHVYCLQTFDVRNNFCYIHTTKNHHNFEEVGLSQRAGTNIQGQTQILIPKQENRFDSVINKNEQNLILNKINKNKLTSLHQTPKKVFMNPKPNQFKAFSASAIHLESNKDLNVYPLQMEEESDFDQDDLRNVYWYYGRCLNHGSNCQRKIVYFISRIAIVVDPLNINVQNFYEGHKSKISVMTVHPKLTLIATGENDFLPKIHIWDPNTCQNVIICDTFHHKGIISLKFSFEKYFLISISVDDSSSMQVSDWRYGNTIAFRNAFPNKIVNVEFDPIDETCFTTVTVSEIDCWKIIGSSIVHMQRVLIPITENREYVTDLLYLNQFLLNKLEKKLLITTSAGKIGLITQNTFFKTEFKETKPICCMKLVLFNRNPIIVIGSHDELLRFYDLNLEEAMPDLRLNYEKRSKSDPHVQSLDLFINGNDLFCLVGLRNGILVEVQITLMKDKYRNKLTYEVKHNKSLIKGHVPLDLKKTTNKNLIDKQILFALHQNLNFMVSVGPDQMLYFWNTEERTPTNVVELGKQPTCVKFTPNMKFLVIGFIDGSLKFYSMAMVKDVNAINLTLEKDYKGDEFTIEHQEISHAVLNIEFSKDSNLVAVSYLNSNRTIEKENATSHYSGNINIYASREFPINGSRSNKDNAYKFHIMLQPSANDQSNIGQDSDIGVSCYFMAFSEDCKYLVAYYQNIHNDLHSRKVSDLSGKYVVYTLESNSLYNPANINYPIQINTLYFPNHLDGRKFIEATIVPSNSFQATLEPKNQHNEQIIVSCIASNNSLATLGTKTGEIYLIKNQMVKMDKIDYAKQNNIDITESYMHDKISLNYYQAKRYPAHSSFINQMEFTKTSGFLFTSGIDDECICQWKISPVVSTSHELEDKIKKPNQIYYLYEVDSREMFDKYITRIHPNRIQIAEIYANKEIQVDPELQLQLVRVIGRKALTRRSNIILLPNKIAYSSGTALILYNISDDNTKLTVYDNNSRDQELNKHNKRHYSNNLNSELASSILSKDILFPTNVDKFAINTCPVIFRKNSRIIETPKESDILLNNQTILFPPKINKFKEASEIMCMELAPDNFTLCVATKAHYSTVHIWEICSESYKGSIELLNCISPIIIRCSFDSQYFICCGVSKEYTPCLYYCNMKKLEILGIVNLKFDDPKHISDMTFLPGQNDKFMTVGFVHCWNWQYRAGILNFYDVKLRDSNSKGFDDGSSTDDYNEIYNWFLVVKYLTKNTYILADVEGSVHICCDGVIHHKKQCSNEPITCVAISSESNLSFVAGGYNTDLYCFKVCMNNENKIHLIFTGRVSITPLFEINEINHENQIQTLFFKSQESLICGTRDGSIYELKADFSSINNVVECYCANSSKPTYEKNMSSEENKNISFFETKKILHFFDHHCPKVADFSYDSSMVFCFSEKGYLITYDLGSLASNYFYDFKDEVVNMYVTSKLIVVIFRNRLWFIGNSCFEVSNKPKSRSAAKKKMDFVKELTRVRDEYIKTSLYKDSDKYVADTYLSDSKNYIAIAYSENSNTEIPPTEIHIYKINVSSISDDIICTEHIESLITNKKDDKNILKLIMKLPANRYRYMDFCLKDKYFLYVSESEAKHIYLVTEDKDSNLGVDPIETIEWQSNGLRVSENCRFLDQYFNSDNHLISIVRIGNSQILTVDELGTVLLLDSII